MVRSYIWKLSKQRNFKWLQEEENIYKDLQSYHT